MPWCDRDRRCSRPRHWHFIRTQSCRAAAKRGTAVFGDASSLHMTTKVTTTSEDEHVHEAVDKMTDGRFRHLPVIRDEQLVGLVSIGDLVKYRLAECEYEHKAMREYIATA